MDLVNEVIQSNPFVWDVLKSTPWTYHAYEGITHAADAQSTLQLNEEYFKNLTDGADTPKPLQDYYDNGQLNKLSNISGINIPITTSAEYVITPNDIKMGYNAMLGLFQYMTNPTQVNDTVSDPPKTMSPSDVRIERMFDVDTDGNITDTGRTLMQVRSDYAVLAMLNKLGYMPTAGTTVKDITNSFLSEYGNDPAVKRAMGKDDYCYALLSAADPDNHAKINVEIPNTFINKFGEWVTEHKADLESVLENNYSTYPVINEIYNHTNKLNTYTGTMLGKSITMIRPSEAGTSQEAWDAFVAGGMSPVSVAKDLYTRAFTALMSYYTGNTTLYNRFGPVDWEDNNWIVSYAIKFGKTASDYFIEMAVSMTNYTMNRTGAFTDLQFLTTDSRFNTGVLLDSNAGFTNVTPQLPWTMIYSYGFRYMLNNASHYVNGNTINNNNSSIGAMLAGLNSYGGLNIGGYEPNPNVTKDENATEWDPEQTNLEGFINAVTGALTFVQNMAGIDIGLGWTLLNPPFGQNPDIEDSEDDQATAGGYVPDIPDILDDGKTKSKVRTPSQTVQDLREKEAEIQKEIERDIANDPAIPIAPAAELDGGLPPDNNNSITPIPIVPGTPSRGGANSFIRAYKVTDGQLDSLAGVLWSENFLQDILKVCSGDAMSNAIISLMDVYSFIAPSVSSATLITLAGVSTGVNATGKVTDRYSEGDIAQIAYNKLYGDFRDYLSNYELYLPGVGYISLDPSVVLLGSYGHSVFVTIHFKIDFYTGEACYTLYNYNDYTSEHRILIGSYSCNMGAAIPISQRSFSSAVSGIGNSIGGAISGNYGSAVSGLLDVVKGSLGIGGDITTKGNYTANSIALGEKGIYMKITRPLSGMYSDIPTIKNYPDYRVMKLANLKDKGLCSIEPNSLRGDFSVCTKEELEEIKSLLQSGVLL